MYHPKAMINLETAAIGPNSYLKSSEGWMLYLILQEEKKKNIHMALEENEPNMTATKAAKEIKQRAKQVCQKDMEKNRTKKPLHGRYLEKERQK